MAKEQATEAPKPKRPRRTAPNRFLLAARAESELQRVGTVITNAQKRLAEACARRDKLVAELDPEVRKLLGDDVAPAAAAKGAKQ